MSHQVFYAAAENYSPETLQKALEKSLLPLLDSSKVAGKRVLLKPNLLFCRRADDLATVDPALIIGVAAMLKEQGARVVILENPGTQNVGTILKKMGIAEKLDAMEIPYGDFVRYQEKELPENCSFRKLKMAREFEDFDLVVDLAKAKTHAMMTLTLAVKNLFGLIDSAGRIGWHLAVGSDFGKFADLLLDIYLAVRPGINIVDGIVAMEGNGPGSGTPAERNFIAASEDALALDASVAERLGVPGEKLILLERAMQRGLDISFVNCGDIPEIRPLKLPDPPGRLNAWGVTLPPFFKKQLRNLIGSRPKLDASECIKCGRCAEVCPPRSLKMDKKGFPVFHLNECIRCYCCQEHCPKGAITTSPQLLTRPLNFFASLLKRK